jgi:multidrug efflux pump subunit AcrB
MTARRASIAGGVLLLAGATVAVYFLIRSLDRNQRDTAPPGPETTSAAPYRFPQVISVTASYPGANARDVADAVAAPIEQQVNGVENMLSMTSACTNDGTYTLQITFKEGTNLDLAQVLVQNRVTLVQPVLPAAVQNTGITVRKRSPQPLVLVSLTSPEGRFDSLYLSNYATIRMKDELARVPGVGDVVLFGQRDDQMRVMLDADKLAARNLTPTDVIAALREQNVQVAAGRIRQPPVPKDQLFQLTISAPGRLKTLDDFGNLIIKNGQPGAPPPAPDAATAVVRLRDVARVELGTNEGGNATRDGKPAIQLGLYPLPNARASELSRAVVEKLEELRCQAPDGLDLAVAFDFSANLEEPDRPTKPEHFVIDMQLPDSASLERTVEALARAAKVVRMTPGIRQVLTLTEHPFSLVRNRPCLMVGLEPTAQRELRREQIAERLRVALRNAIPDAVFRLSVPSTADGFPVYGWPIDFAIEDRADQGWAHQQQRAQALIDRMMRSGKFLDVGAGPGSHGSALLYMDIDRVKCQALGVRVEDVFTTLQMCLGSYYVNDFNQFGRTWPVNVQVDQKLRGRAADILKQQVRNKEGQLIRLGTVMEVRDTTGPAVIERHNLYPMARVTANLAEGVSMAEARALCETMADQEFASKGFKLIWQP